MASGRVVLDRRIGLIDNLATSESFRMFDGPRAVPSPGEYLPVLPVNMTVHDPRVLPMAGS